MRIGLVQFDPLVGDLEGNVSRLAQMILTAPAADLYVTGELSLLGYPPRDLLQREGVGEACVAAAGRLATLIGDRAALVGLARPVAGAARPLANSVALLRGGRVESFYDKRLLPAYDVFDEERYFAPGSAPLVANILCGSPSRVGILVCEDIWRAVDAGLSLRYEDDPAAEAVAAGADVLAVLTASPFGRGKHQLHLNILSESARRFGRPIVSVNQSGADDDLVFDGSCTLIAADGSIIHASGRWGEGVEVVELGASSKSTSSHTLAASREHKPTSSPPEDAGDVFCALRCGISGYFRKTGFQRAIIGLSGGIDSAVVAALACAALGAKNVRGICMPSRHSSAGSLEDAISLAKALGMSPPDVIPINDLHSQHSRSMRVVAPIEGLADENLQSRVRGLTLLTLSNATGALVLTTGNKSEYATGYCTLGGDMLGGIAPIGDLLKNEVYELARWMNDRHMTAGFPSPPIPQSSIDKDPSAELRPDQRDQDSLPPYADLDTIVSAWVNGERDSARIAAAHQLPLEMVQKWTTAIERAEYKRLQAPLVLKISARAFGRGRRMPIACRWRPLGAS